MSVKLFLLKINFRNILVFKKDILTDRLSKPNVSSCFLSRTSLGFQLNNVSHTDTKITDSPFKYRTTNKVKLYYNTRNTKSCVTEIKIKVKFNIVMKPHKPQNTIINQNLKL